MKTKEIDVWVKEDFNDKYSTSGIYYFNRSDLLDDNYRNIPYKAKLIIEIPEKKIEITESEFDRVYNDWVVSLEVVNYHKDLHKRNMKRDLGFDDE